MNIVFDPAKDEANVAKHGISLAYVADHRFNEPRFRLYGLIDGEVHCVASTDRDGIIRVISLRRAHAKEMRRYAQ